MAAVYKFRDHTGQYKPSENGANWSTAVTQGATTILMRALEESRWFVPIERENLSNLLNERKIIRSSRAQYQENPAPLPPLLFAGVMLEGGIISYQTNTVTGGAGLRYFGAGASGQYREDKVSIYLRAVSTSNGKVLKTVYTSKTILSQTVDVGFFRFVSFERLLEFETGYTYNEPADMAVTEAIEKAVVSMVLDGAKDGLWTFSDSTAWDQPLVNDYFLEKERNYKVDEFDKERDDDLRTNFALGFNTGAWLYAGDYPNAVAQPFGEASMSYSFNPKLFMSLNIGRGALAVEQGFEQDYYNTELLLNWRLYPDYKFTPYFFGGVSALFEPDFYPELESQYSNYNGMFGLGFEQSLARHLDLNFAFFNNYSFNDDLDGEVNGRFNDFNWGAKIGLKFYLPAKESKTQND